MPTVPGARVMLSNTNDTRVQKHPDNMYVETEKAWFYDASDGTGVDIAVAAQGTPALLLHASAFTSDSIGDITVDATTGLFTIKHNGKYRLRFEGRVTGENSAVVQLSPKLNSTDVTAALRQHTYAAAALPMNLTLEHYLDCVSGDTVGLNCDSSTNGDNVNFDGFSLSIELVESQE